MSSYSNLDPYIAELFKQRDAHDRELARQHELNNKHNLSRSLSDDDDAELIFAIIPNENNVCPPHSKEIYKIWNEEGFDAAVEKARQLRKAQTSSNKGGRKKTRKYRKTRKSRKAKKSRKTRKSRKAKKSRKTRKSRRSNRRKTHKNNKKHKKK